MGKFLLQLGRALAAAVFDLGQVILADTNRDSQFALDHVAPFADDPYRIIAIGEAINYRLWQHHLTAFLDGADGIADDPAGCGVFLRLRGKSDQAVVIVARQYREIVSARGMNELHVTFDAVGFSHVASQS